MRRSRWILLVLSPLLIVGVARFCHHRTNGFKMTKIRANCPRSEVVEVSSLPKDLESSLAQPFTYLGRGKQSFAFLSADKTTVLKLFNNRYQRKIFWYSLLPFLKDQALYNRTKLERLSTSYALAFEELQSKTGLLYLHLSPTTHLQRTVTLIDKLGIAHTIALDETGFALQKRGTLSYAHLSNLMRAGKKDEAIQSLRSMLELIISRCKLGIADNDPLIRTNLGFLGSRPFYIDIGPFSKDEGEKERDIWGPEILKITTSLRHWLENHHPSLVNALQEMVERQLPAPKGAGLKELHVDQPKSQKGLR